MKKITVIFLIIGVLAISAYIYVRHSLHTPGFASQQPKDRTSQTKPSESFLDLKPKLVEKLQQLVKQGSNGLYNLFIHEVNPDILKSTIGISHALLVPDTVVMKKLEASGQLPDEIFKIKTDSIWIDGLGIKDLLSKDVIDLKTVHIHQPVIEVYTGKNHQSKKQDPKTLYQRLMNQMKHIGIDTILTDKGTLIVHEPEKNKSTQFNDIAIRLINVVIDSSTQFDKKRFLFARDAGLTLKNYSVPTSNNLYTFKIGIISIKAAAQSLVARNIILQPLYSKTAFQKHITAQKERYEIAIPSIEFRNTDWWNLINKKVLKAEYAEINKAQVSVYLDRRMPSAGNEKRSFPHQLLMQLPIKLHIAKLKVNDLDLTYEEFSKLSGKSGKLYIDNLHGTISNLTNLPEAIKQNKTTTVVSTGTFMHVAPADLVLHFDLSKYKTGAFSATVTSRKGFDGTLVNPIAEPLGLFMVKKGELNKLQAQISGNNDQASGTVLMLYTNLHVTPLKKDSNEPGQLKKKSVTSFIANAFVLKDENPSKNGEVRKENVTAARGSGTFFNLVWKTILTGILKTIGAPEKLANP